MRLNKLNKPITAKKNQKWSVKKMANNNGNNKNGKMDMLEFSKRAILKLRTDKSKGIHSVFSGFNAAFKEYYGVEAKDALNDLVDGGKIVRIPCRKGVMLYLPEDAPASASSDAKAKKALAAILG